MIIRKALLNLVSTTFAYNDFMRAVLGMFVLFVATVFQAKWAPFMRSMHWMSSLEVVLIAVLCVTGLARVITGAAFVLQLFSLYTASLTFFVGELHSLLYLVLAHLILFVTSLPAV